MLLDLGGGGVELAYISAISRPYLGYISAASRLGGGGVELAYISAISRPYLGYISAASRLGGGGVQLARHVGGGDGGAVREALHLVERRRAVGRL